MAEITVTCPDGHQTTITAPTAEQQLVGVVDGVEQFDVVNPDEIAVKCCHAEYDDRGRATVFCDQEFIVNLEEQQ